VDSGRETLAAEDEIGEARVADLGNTTLLPVVESGKHRCRREVASGYPPWSLDP